MSSSSSVADISHRIAVTGANGFLGRSLCRIATRRGWQVIAVVRRLCDLTDATEVVTVSLTDTLALTEAFRGCAAVVHTAGLAHVFGKAAAHDSVFHVTNVLGTETVAYAARAAGVPQLVLASSVSVYGGSHYTADHKPNTNEVSGVDESTPPNPRTSYARSKWASEQVAAKCFADHGCLTVLRFATLYGEGDRGNVTRLIAFLRRGRFVWIGQGLNRKSLIYKDDAARACIVAVQEPVAGVYNISAPPVSMQEIVQTICQALKQPVPRVQIPNSLLQAVRSVASYVGALKPLERQIETFLHDDVYRTERFCQSFRWQPETNLAEGIAHQVGAYSE